MENINAECYRVCVDNKRIGEFIKNDDGYFFFFLERYNGGGLDEWLLRELADELKRINEPWDQVVTHYEAELDKVVHAPGKV